MMDQFLLTCCTGNYKHFDKNQNILHLVLSLELWCLDMQIKVGWFPKRYILVWTGIKLGHGTRRFWKSWVCSTARCRSDSGKGSLGKSIALLTGESQQLRSVPQHEARSSRNELCALYLPKRVAQRKQASIFPVPTMSVVLQKDASSVNGF